MDCNIYSYVENAIVIVTARKYTYNQDTVNVISSQHTQYFWNRHWLKTNISKLSLQYEHDDASAVN